MNIPLSREYEYWSPEPLFAGETVFCLASGPSLTLDVCDKLAGRRTIAVNSSLSLMPDASALFFTDSGWFEAGRLPQYCGNVRGTSDVWPRRVQLEDFTGLIFTMSKSAKIVLPDIVKRVKGDGDPDPSISPPNFARGPGVIQQGRSSGHTAVSLAIALGAKRVVLLGYDMRFVGGREHFHQEYKGPRDVDIYQRDFIPAFKGWDAAAKAVGVEILNATPESAVREFRSVTLDEVLECEAC